MQSYESDLPKIEEFITLGGKEMLEIGCGAGRLTSSLVPKAGAITAIDPDPAQIALARANVAGVDFRVGSGEQLEFSDRSFDIVFFSYSLHHQKCAAALKEAMRVEHPFENETECFRYFMDKFGSGSNNGAIEKMKNILGNKVGSEPMVVADIVNILLLEGIV